MHRADTQQAHNAHALARTHTRAHTQRTLHSQQKKPPQLFGLVDDCSVLLPAPDEKMRTIFMRATPRIRRFNAPEAGYRERNVFSTAHHQHWRTHCKPTHIPMWFVQSCAFFRPVVFVLRFKMYVIQFVHYVFVLVVHISRGCATSSCW